MQRQATRDEVTIIFIRLLICRVMLEKAFLFDDVIIDVCCTTCAFVEGLTYEQMDAPSF